MPSTINAKNNSISRDALAGYDNSSKIKSAYERIGVVAKDVNAMKSTPWKRVWDYLPRITRNVRDWVIREQETAFFGASGLNSQHAEIPALGVWLDLKDASFSPPGGGVIYPVRNSHVDTGKRSGSFTIWRAPRAGDYLVNMTFICDTNATTGDDYADIYLAYRENESATWQAPVSICGGGNQKTQSRTRIYATGSYLVRMSRGSQLRFGAKQIGQSGGTPSPNAITPTALEIRVSIAKQKFYPTLKD
jgi:hypothetical protein